MATRKRDPAEIETDKIIAEIERRITTEYRQAEREIKERLDDYLRRFQEKDDTWRRWVSDGKRSTAEYQQWRTGQIAIGQRWEDMRATLSRDLMNTESIARSIARGYMPEVYAINHNYATFECEKGSGIDTSYTLYSREAVERMMRDNPQMLPAPGRKVSQEIAEGRAERWNNNHIQSVMMQGILQGNTISDLATRLANVVGDTSRKAAIRNARTMATATQNAGRQDAYKRAKSKGIETQKQWMATLDMRTRHDHRAADLQTVEVEEPFIVGGYEMMYPGDYSAPGSQVYNCRCTTRAVLAGITSGSLYNADGSDARDTSRLEGLTYDEWQKSRVEKPENILRPDRRADDARARYIREYAENPRLDVPSGRRTDLSIDALNEPQQNTPFHNQNLANSLGRDYTGFRDKIDGASTRPLYEKYADDAKLQKTKGSGCYYPRTDKLEYHLENRPGRDKYSILAHEYGHLFDKHMGRMNGLHFGEIDKINEKCKGSLLGFNILKEVPSSSDEFIGALRTDLANLKAMLESGDLTKAFSATDEMRNATSGVQDALDGAYSTQKNFGKYNLPWGHGDKYYNRKYNQINGFGLAGQLKEAYQELGYDASSQAKTKTLSRIYETASEAWANISSAFTVGGEELTQTRKYLPLSSDVFVGIIEMEVEQ